MNYTLECINSDYQLKENVKMKAPPAMCRDYHDGMYVRVELPELEDYDGDDPTDKMAERAGKALAAAIWQHDQVYLDGEGNPPADVWIELTGVDDAHEWRIER